MVLFFCNKKKTGGLPATEQCADLPEGEER